MDTPIAIKGNALAYEFDLSNNVMTKVSFTTSEDSLRRPYGYKGESIHQSIHPDRGQYSQNDKV